MGQASAFEEFPMRRAILGVARGILLTLTASLAATTPAAANYYELLRRVPDSTNTLILIDVERMLMSPIAMKEKWRDKANSPEAGTIHFPVNSKRFLLASKLDFVSGSENPWDIALIETATEVSLPFLSKIEGGYIDSVDGQQIAYSPRNAFLVSFAPDILGVSFPANKQDLARWLRTLRRHEEPQVSQYLQDAVKLAHGKDHMVVAFDLGDLFTDRMLRERLRRAESLAGKNVDLDVLSKVFASVKGVTLAMEAGENLEGRIRVEFGESPAPLKEIARPLIFEVLEIHNMLLDEIKDWRILVEARAITLEGRMTTEGLRTMTDLIPFPTGTLDLQNSAAKAGATPETAAGSPTPQDAKTAASKKYFDHVHSLLQQLRTDLKDPVMSPKIARRIVGKAAQAVDRLPVLDVDEELIAYGAGVSHSLRNMRNLSKTASLDATYRQASMAANQGDGYGYGGFYGGGGSSLSLSTSTMRKQESAALQANELEVITMLEEKSAEMRRKMTLKHHVEF